MRAASITMPAGRAAIRRYQFLTDDLYRAIAFCHARAGTGAAASGHSSSGRYFSRRDGPAAPLRPPAAGTRTAFGASASSGRLRGADSHRDVVAVTQREPPSNWVFLGDSITEGVGSLRVTFVSELVNRLRASSTARRYTTCGCVKSIRSPSIHSFGPISPVISARIRTAAPALWVWNLGSEGRTIDTDQQWLPFLENLRPERVFIHRGSLESILRPACFHDGRWPFWVPRSWRGLVSMDPRCYFSDTPLRRLKQSFIDSAKQRARRRLLREGAPKPLIDPDQILAHYDALLQALRALPARVTVLGLLAPERSHLSRVGRAFSRREHAAALAGGEERRGLSGLARAIQRRRSGVLSRRLPSGSRRARRDWPKFSTRG